MKKWIAVIVMALTAIAVPAQEKQAAPSKTTSPAHHRGKRNHKKAHDSSLCHVRPAGYAEVCGIDIDELPAEATASCDHPPIYLSYSNRDALAWYSGSGHKFHVQVRKFDGTCEAKDLPKQKKASSCPMKPFKNDLSDGPADDLQPFWYSGPVKSESAIGCYYKMKIHRDDGKDIDPHIIIGG